MRFTHPSKFEEQLITWFSEMNHTTFVTLAFNPNKDSGRGNSKSLLTGGMRTAVNALSRWDAHINSKVVGSKWQSRNSHKRMTGVAVPENIATNFHWHFMCTPPIPKPSYWDNGLRVANDNDSHDAANDNDRSERPLTPEEFAPIVDVTWRKICYNGTTKTVSINDPRGLAEYITKQCYLSGTDAGFELLGR